MAAALLSCASGLQTAKVAPAQTGKLSKVGASNG